MAELATADTVIGWVSIGETLALWSAAPGEPEDGYAPLPALLGVAHEVMEAYAPAVQGAPPERYKMAQVLYTQHLWARKQSGDTDSSGVDGLAISTYPLVMEARSLVRPRRSQFGGLR